MKPPRDLWSLQGAFSFRGWFYGSRGIQTKAYCLPSADVEGYSRLIRKDEQAIVLALTTYRAAILQLIEQYRGRVTDSPVADILAEFGSLVDAVECALKIQEALKAKNAEAPENRRMEFRMGVNLGDSRREAHSTYSGPRAVTNGPAVPAVCPDGVGGELQSEY